MRQLGFYAILARAYFCCIARNDDINIFSVVLQGHKGLTLQYAKCWLQEAMRTMIKFFMLYCNEWATMIQFLHPIAREWAMIAWYCSKLGCIVLQRSKRWYKKSTIARMQGTVARVWQLWPTTQRSNFYMLSIEMMTANELISQESTTMSISSMSYHEKSNNSYIFVVERGSHIARSLQQQWASRRETWGRNNQTLHMLLIAWITATSILWYIVLQEAMTTMVDCNKRMQDCATQWPTKYLCCIEKASNNRGMTKLLMQWSCPSLSCKRLQRWGLRLIATSTQDRTSDKQPFSLM